MAGNRNIAKRALIATLVFIGVLVCVGSVATLVAWWRDQVVTHRHAVDLVSNHADKLVSMVSLFHNSGLLTLARTPDGPLVNGKLVACSGGGCEIKEGWKVLDRAPSMEGALTILGARPDATERLVGLMKQLGISFINGEGPSTPGTQRYIELYFDSTLPVGLIYVPDSSAAARADFADQACHGASYPYVEIDRLSDAWFYFRGRV